MPFADRLFAGDFPVALEITPPQSPRPKVLLRRARLLGPWAAAVNVIQRPGRQSSLEASIALRQEQIEPVWHLVTRGLTREQLEADLGLARDADIRQILCIRGDHAGAGAPGGLTIRETIALARAALPQAAIGATLNQYAPNPDAALKNLWPKLEAGATYIQMQPVFDLGSFAPLAEEVRKRAPHVRIVPMAMPILSRDACERVSRRIGAPMPANVNEGLGDDGDGAWPAFRKTLSALAASGLADAVAIMTFEMDAPAELGAAICDALAAAGLRAEHA